MATLGRVLRTARERRGISQRDLAAALGTDQGNLSRRENDRGGMPAGELERFVKTTGVPLLVTERGWEIHEPPAERLPFYGKVPCGRPLELQAPPPQTLDLAALTHGGCHADCFVVTAHGDSMEGAGIYDGDFLIVDRTREAKPQHIVVAMLNDETTVKRLVRHPVSGRPMLVAAHARYRPLELGSEEELRILGVVVGKLKYVPLA